MGGGWWFLIILILLFGGALGHNLLFLLGVLLALVSGASAVWTRYCLTNVTYQRQFGKDHLFHGEETDFVLELVNLKPLPLAWLITVDEWPSAIELHTGPLFPSGTPRRRLLINTLSLRWYERVTRRYRVTGKARGVWTFGPLQLSSGGVFGFSVRRETFEAAQTVIVYPKIVPLTVLNLQDWHPFGSYKTPRQVLDDPLQLMGTREYIPGDSYRHIHWKATARQGVLQTKVFEPSASRPLVVFMNGRTTNFANEGIDLEILEFVVTVAASTTHWAWQQGHPVGLFVNSVYRSSRERIQIRPGKAADQFIQVLEALAWMENDGLWTLNTLLKAEARTLPYGTSLVVITSLFSEQLGQTLRDLKRRSYGVTLITVGDAAVSQTALKPKLPGIWHYYLGNREAWRDLETLALAE